MPSMVVSALYKLSFLIFTTTHFTDERNREVKYFEKITHQCTNRFRIVTLELLDKKQGKEL